MSDQPEPESEDLFGNEPPSDVVPTEPQPMDDETRRRLREADGKTAHILTFRTATDVEGQPLSVGWHHEVSGTLHASPRLDNEDQ